MKPMSFALAFVLCTTMSARGDDTSPVNDGRVRPPSHKLLPSLDDVPPFGIALQQWSLQMSGGYAGAGITWVRDSGKFYLADQGYSGPPGVWNLDPADPESTIEAVPWTFTDLGDSTVDIPWGIAWDPDSGCFWTSQIVDGNPDIGCYLLRYVWNDSSWAWGGATGDSWLVGTGSNGGGLSCRWLGGMDKSLLDGRFYAAPVCGSPSELNYVVRFDPYSKTNLGRVAYGDQISERGCALIPWDSSYILTCGWPSASYRKRDSTGYLLTQVSAGSGPADWALYFPSVIRPEDTVCAYCINSNSANTLQRISTGMLWGQLGSAVGHNVRPERVLSPTGVVDSGMTITPRIVVRNIGQETADSIDVHFVIDDETDVVIYHDSTYVLDMPGGSVDTVAFAPWVSVGRDSMGCVAWTFWSGDSNVHDDTIFSRFLVRVINVGITHVYRPLPGETIDSGTTVYPQLQVFNYGNLTMTFPVTFRIGGWSDTAMVTNLLAGASRTVTAASPWTATPGIWGCGMSAILAGDLHPEDNDTMFIFYVRRTSYADVACEGILVPSGVMDTTPFLPRALYANHGTSDATCTTYCWIEDTISDVIVYSDSAPVLLVVGDTLTAGYRPCTLKVEGPYVVTCSIHLADDQNWLNNVIHQDFRVGPGVGIEGELKLKAAGCTPEPTVVRGTLKIPLAARHQQPATLHDPMGRLVMFLKPEDNDIRHVAPGVYFLRSADNGGRSAVRKIVIQR
ncbi:MAG: T9SS type A sorting domain-containing protein [candidate division WOR-3 bacterium]|nr:MAG: T9SS type A sorting domain-containing protein [candidate division WOR-3 bacterium]